MIKKQIFQFVRRFVFPNKGVTHIKREPRVIVSLTSYPRRINTIVPVIDSLLRQSLKPDMLILWLAEAEFPKREQSLPRRLRRYAKFGLQIEWCDNIKSYKKLVPALRKYPEDIIVTADDDILYPETWLESLYTAHILHTDEIVCQYAYQPCLDRQSPQLRSRIVKQPGLLSGTQIVGSGGGALFPPRSLCEDITDVSLFGTLAPHNDDYWIWAMAKLKGTPMRLVDDFMDNMVCVEETQQDGLWESGNMQGTGITEFTNIIQRYPVLQKETALSQA